MSSRITCPRCEGKVIVPDQPASNVVCPFCRQFLMAIDQQTGAAWMPRKPTPRWVIPLGLLTTLAAIILFFPVYYVAEVNSHGYPDRALLAAIKNPVFLAPMLIGPLLALGGRLRG